MAWKRVNPKQQYAQTVTVRANGGLGLSAQFISAHDLEEYEYVETFVDEDLRRIGWKFYREQTANTCSLQKESDAGRVISASHLNSVDWFAEVTQLDKEERRFLVEIDESVADPAEGVRFYISLGYRFESRRTFSDENDYPRSAGVYRLFSHSELIRIGESDCIERRLKEHKVRYSTEVDEYDFCKISDTAARKGEEKRLLADYKDAYGRLPKLNQITS